MGRKGTALVPVSLIDRLHRLGAGPDVRGDEVDDLLHRAAGQEDAADAHGLELVKKGATAKTIARYIPGQPWYEPAAALLILTAVFARTQWRYPFARAYRSVLLEAGHVCQTFCLAATWLGLAPFCTGRFADDLVEREMKIDGVTESFIYGAGVGSRPAGLDWAPWPEAVEPESDA